MVYRKNLHILRTLKCLIVKTIHEIKLYQMSGFKIYCFQQRWSRGHKARSQSQGQGHKKKPDAKAKVAFPRTEPLEAKNRNARDQGQAPRTQAQAFS